jgi:hypothetical protein
MAKMNVIMGMLASRTTDYYVERKLFKTRALEG